MSLCAHRRSSLRRASVPLRTSATGVTGGHCSMGTMLFRRDGRPLTRGRRGVHTGSPTLSPDAYPASEGNLASDEKHGPSLRGLGASAPNGKDEPGVVQADPQQGDPASAVMPPGTVEAHPIDARWEGGPATITRRSRLSLRLVRPRGGPEAAAPQGGDRRGARGARPGRVLVSLRAHDYRAVLSTLTARRKVSSEEPAQSDRFNGAPAVRPSQVTSKWSRSKRELRVAADRSCTHPNASHSHSFCGTRCTGPRVD